jgi:hypothetical protein
MLTMIFIVLYYTCTLRLCLLPRNSIQWASIYHIANIINISYSEYSTHPILTTVDFTIHYGILNYLVKLCFPFRVKTLQNGRRQFFKALRKQISTEIDFIDRMMHAGCTSQPSQITLIGSQFPVFMFEKS